MTVFRAPSASTTSSSPHPSQKPPPKRTKMPRPIARRLRTRHLNKANAAAKDAARRSHRKKRRVAPCVAYVGNIGPNVDERMLKAHFRRCGEVLDVKIHCCGGVAMLIEPPPSDYIKDFPVRQYGIVAFGGRPARAKALRMRRTLDGRELTVCVTVLQLPEVVAQIEEYVETCQGRKRWPGARFAEQCAFRSSRISRNPTVLLDHVRPPKHDRFHILGISLPKGIL